MSKRLWQTHHSRDTIHGHSRETSGNVKEWRLGSTWMWLCSHFGGGSLGLCSAIYAQLMATCRTWKLIEIDYGPHPLLFPLSATATAWFRRTKQIPELTWGQLRNCIRDKQRTESHLYLFDYYLYAPSPGRRVKCRHSPMHVRICVCVCVCTYVLPVQTTNRRQWCLCWAAAFEVRQGKRTSIVRISPHYPLDCGRPDRAGLSDVQRDIATCGRP